jgi:hypothetical protein
MPRPKKKFRSLDEEDIVLPQTEEIDPDPTTDLTLLDDDDVVPSNDLTTEKEEFSVNGDDDSKELSISAIHTNPPPPKAWSDNIKLKFNIGVLVCIKGVDKIYKVCGPGREEHTFVLKVSGSTAETVAKEKEIKIAPNDAVWVSHWDVISDPYRDWKRKQELLKSTKKEEPVPVKPKRKYKKRKK